MPPRDVWNGLTADDTFDQPICVDGWVLRTGRMVKCDVLYGSKNTASINNQTNKQITGDGIV